VSAIAWRHTAKQEHGQRQLSRQRRGYQLPRGDVARRGDIIVDSRMVNATEHNDDIGNFGLERRDDISADVTDPPGVRQVAAWIGLASGGMDDGKWLGTDRRIRIG
jgi:hypothetical protein